MCWTISDPDVLKHLRGFEKWENLRTVSRIRSYRYDGKQESVEDRYHIAGAKRLLTVSHLKIGYIGQDIAFDEDQCRVSKDNGPLNFDILHHTALNLLKLEKTSKAQYQWLNGCRRDGIILIC